MLSNFSNNELDKFIQSTLSEDIGDGDHSSLACIPEDKIGRAKLLVKENGLLAGVDIAKSIFFKLNPDCKFEPLMKDGDIIKTGDIAFIIETRQHDILKAERLVLNCMQRMSGIATKTNQIVKLIEGTNAKLLDTRKTTPGIRFLEKMAVKIGGGYNHRFGLYDMIMLKDNHIDFAGGIEKAIIAANKYLVTNNKNLKIEVEARNIEELKEILNIGKIDRIMLDNFTPDELKQAIHIISGRYETEASGGITESNIRNYAETGVDFISVGALTHNIKSIDLSLKAI